MSNGVCDVCGEPTKSQYGVCVSKPECRKEYDRRKRIVYRASAPEPGTCDVCGQPLTKRNGIGVCTRTDACKRERSLRWRTAHPEDMRHAARKWRANNRDFAAEKNREYRVTNRDSVLENTRRSDLRRNYSMTLEDYDRMLALQGGGCAICRRTPEENGRRLGVDHDHSCCAGSQSCGKCVRGLLCNNCNNGIGLFADDASRLTQGPGKIVHAA